MIEGTNPNSVDFDSPVTAVGNTSGDGNVSMADVIADLRERKKNILEGGINCIPLPFPRFRSEMPGIEQEQYIVLTAGTKAGKCFGKGTRIRMADNTIKNIEDINVGDWVMSPNDEPPKQVLSLGHGKEQLYCVSSEMHKDLIVNESHVMYIYLPSKKRYTTMTIKELYAEQQKNTEFYFKHSRKAVLSDECELFITPILDIEPYFYGIWLGDGSTNDVDITTPEPEIVEYLKEYSQRLGMSLSEYPKKNENCSRYAIRRKTRKDKVSFKQITEKVCNWQKKHINRNYLNASIKDRYQLLAGIIDTDGYLNRSKSGYCITMQYLSCINDIQELANSLGIATTIRTKYNKKYKKNYYEIRLNGKNCVKIPLRVSRKKCKVTIKDFNHYPFTIKPIGVDEYYGITLGGNHLFLLEDFTIVHNTQLASFLYLYNVLDYAFEHRDQCSVHIIYFALEESQMRIKQRYISHLLYKIDGVRYSPSDLRSTSADFPIPDEVLDKIETDQYKERLDFFDECVQFETEDTNPTGILRVCEDYAKKVGEYKTFQRKSRSNPLQTVEVFQSYKPYDKKHYKIVLLDHIGLIDVERGMNLKQSMDKLSEYCVKYLRNRLKYTVVAVQQQAMETEGLEAIKQKKMVPAVAGLGDTKYTARDGNYVLGLFDPSLFGLPAWLGYKINDESGGGLRGYSRFLYLLRGRDGEQGGICPLYFDGAVCYFEELPMPDDVANMDKFYARVKNIKSFKQLQKQQQLSKNIFSIFKNFLNESC